MPSQIEELIKILIPWAPTIILVVALLWALISGLIRGFRKSLILFIHMLVIGGLCLGAFIYITSDPAMDEKIVGYANQILVNFDMSVQGLLGVDSSYTNLHQMVMDLILFAFSKPYEPTRTVS